MTNETTFGGLRMRDDFEDKAMNLDWTKLDDVTLATGKHPMRELGMCLLEAVAWVAGEPHSDHPQCVCRIVASFTRRLNDLLHDDERQLLKACAPLMVGTEHPSYGVHVRRVFRLTDWAVREAIPLKLEARGCVEQATLLRRLRPIVDCFTAGEARDAVDSIDGAACAIAEHAKCGGFVFIGEAAANVSIATLDMRGPEDRRAIVESAIAVLREVCEMRDEP